MLIKSEERDVPGTSEAPRYNSEIEKQVSKVLAPQIRLFYSPI